MHPPSHSPANLAFPAWSAPGGVYAWRPCRARQDPMILWSYDPMILWSYDPMILWACVQDRLTLWSYDPMILWFYDPMILWSYDPMILWSYEPVYRIAWPYDPMILWSWDLMILWSYESVRDRLILWFLWSYDPYDPMILWSYEPIQHLMTAPEPSPKSRPSSSEIYIQRQPRQPESCICFQQYLLSTTAAAHSTFSEIYFQKVLLLKAPVYLWLTVKLWKQVL